ncbi:MAG: SDR family NAD(P)-dependent oxidoreductase [Gemmatimonadetes bacterium]|nr:SDR family NAD(P)-dependent oxidoreductase [Gemmatimonadota bacterium]
MGGEETAIVNVSSLLAMKPKRSAPVYCATKAALRSFECRIASPRGWWRAHFVMDEEIP